MRLPSHFRLIALICLAVAFGLSACSAPATIVREASSPKRPAWIEKPPQGGATLYFVGIRTYADTLEDGQAAAIKDAMAKISGFLGIRIESTTDDEVSDTTQQFKKQVKSKTQSIIKGASIVDSYHEKVTRIDRNFKIEKYDVFVLASFSKQEAQKEVARQQAEKQSKVQLAYDNYLKGLAHENGGKYSSANEYFSQALAAMSGLDEIIAIDGRDISNSNDLKHAIQSHQEAVTSLMRRVTLSLKIHGSSSNVFEDNFSAHLSKQGFFVTDKKPAFEIKGKVSLSDGGYVLNNHVSYAEGRVSARRISDGQEIAVYSFRAKGFHRTREQSALDALKEAGVEAGDKLSEILLKKAKLSTTDANVN